MTALPRCTVRGCARPIGRTGARGLCHSHYVAARLGLSLHPITPQRRLTYGDAVEIRRRARYGGVATTQAALATEYGCSKSSIWRVLHGLTH